MNVALVGICDTYQYCNVFIWSVLSCVPLLCAHKIVISGNYLPSSFGLSLEILVHLHTFVREVTPAKLADIVSSP